MFKKGDRVTATFKNGAESCDKGFLNANKGQNFVVSSNSGRYCYCDNEKETMVPFLLTEIEYTKIPANKLSKKLYPNYIEKDGYLTKE